MNKQINNLIPIAISAIKANMADPKDSYIVAKEAKGDVSSFAAGLVQSGLFPTLTFFSETSKNDKKDGNTNKRRHKMLAALLCILQEGGTLKDELKKITPAKNDLLHYALEYCTDKKTNTISLLHETALMRDLNNAIIALKMALRIFSDTTKTDDNDNK